MFIVSLAIADLIVGVIVMPISAAYIILGQWKFGIVVCQFWVGVDYTASTASILNLLVLSMDRYWSVTSPLQYLHKRTSHRAFVMISVAWCLSLLWIVPIIGWHHFASGGVRLVPPDVCDTEYATNTPLKLVTAFVNYYVPLLIMFGLYTKVFVEIRKRSKLEITQARNACMPRGRAPSVSETAVDEIADSSAYEESTVDGKGTLTRRGLLQSLRTLNVVSMNEQRRANYKRNSSQMTTLPTDHDESSPSHTSSMRGYNERDEEEMVPLTSSYRENKRPSADSLKKAGCRLSQRENGHERRFHSISLGESNCSKTSTNVKKELLRQGAITEESNCQDKTAASSIRNKVAPPLAIEEDSAVSFFYEHSSTVSNSSPIRCGLSETNLTTTNMLQMRMVATLSSLSTKSGDGRLAVRDVVNHFRSANASPSPSTRNLHTENLSLQPSRMESRLSSPVIETVRSVRFKTSSADNLDTAHTKSCSSGPMHARKVTYSPISGESPEHERRNEDRSSNRFRFSRFSRVIRVRRKKKKPKSALLRQAKHWRRKIERHRLRISASLAMEIKAAKQLGVIMGAFTICFLPYFVCFIIVPFCKSCVSDNMMTVVTWFGYLNSTFNPILYPLCNSNFRRRFYQMLHSPVASLRRKLKK